MAVERTYYCNLCRERFDVKDPKLIGFEFTGGRPYEIREKPARGVENHICMPCGQQVRLVRVTSGNPTHSELIEGNQLPDDACALREHPDDERRLHS